MDRYTRAAQCLTDRWTGSVQMQMQALQKGACMHACICAYQPPGQPGQLHADCKYVCTLYFTLLTCGGWGGWRHTGAILHEARGQSPFRISHFPFAASLTTRATRVEGT